MHVTQFVNSFVGRPGNVGVRTGHILKHLESKGSCVCRGSEIHLPKVDYLEMGLFGHMPRVLNGIRIHIAPQFDHRKWDISLFEAFALHSLDRISTEVAHVWDACPKLIRNLKNRGVPVLLDVPIAPSHYVRKVLNSSKEAFLSTSLKLYEWEQKAFAEVDLIVAPSTFVASVLYEMGLEDKTIVIEFGVDIPKKPIVRESFYSNSNTGIDFCFVGNINRRKGIRELMEAWSCSAFREDRLHLCGRVNSDVNSYLMKNTPGKVIIPGFTNPFEYMAKCDVFVLPSWLEGSAKSVYEAMACGLPSVVTHSAGSIIRDGIDGFIINAGDVKELREKMLWLKNNPDQAMTMGKTAAQRARHFTWELYSKRIIELYSKLSKSSCYKSN